MSDEKAIVVSDDKADLWKLACAVAKSPFAPKGLTTADAIYVAMHYGREIGFSPLQAIHSIAVINGRPSVYGDGLMAVCRAADPSFRMDEAWTGSGDSLKMTCTVTRGDQKTTAEFGVSDAKTARLWGKEGPWSMYPKRMIQMRARGFALRDAFADRLKGIITTEEALDLQSREPARDPIAESVLVESEKAEMPTPTVDDAAFDSAMKSLPRSSPSGPVVSTEPATAEEIDAALFPAKKP